MIDGPKDRDKKINGLSGITIYQNLIYLCIFSKIVKYIYTIYIYDKFYTLSNGKLPYCIYLDKWGMKSVHFPHLNTCYAI